MTCIVGMSLNNKVYIGADSAGVDSYFNRRIRSDLKVFIKNNFIFGFTSSFRMGQIIKYKFAPESKRVTESEEEYIHVTVLDHIIQILTDNKYTRLDSNVIEGGNFLFGYNGQLYSCQSDFQIERVQPIRDDIQIITCGCGEQYALGSLYSSLTGNEYKDSLNDAKIRKVISTSLMAAQYFSCGVCEPFTILDI